MLPEWQPLFVPDVRASFNIGSLAIDGMLDSWLW